MNMMRAVPGTAREHFKKERYFAGRFCPLPPLCYSLHMKTASKSLAIHKKLKGKIEVTSKAKLKTRQDLSVFYTPGVGEAASFLGKHPELAREYTVKRNTVAVVSDGSAVLGLGNIGPMAALPVMEGKAMIFKEFAGVDAFPIVLSTQDPEEIIQAVAAIAPGFGGINLEDISAPRCFAVERRLKEMLDIPVFHDDQHGTAIIVLAGVLNALKVVHKSLAKVRIAVAGAGAAGNAVANLLFKAGAREIRVVDTKGILSARRQNLGEYKMELAKLTNPHGEDGTLRDAMKDADVFIGVAAANLIGEEDVRTMAPRAIVFGLSNPVPEIMPDAAKRAGAAVIATGRSDFPNQINNALVFPGIFRGALDRGVKSITDDMKLAAAKKLAALVKRPSPQMIIPSVFDKRVMKAIASAIK